MVYWALCSCLATVASAQNVILEVEPNHSTVGFSLDIAQGFSRVTGKFTDYTIDINYVDADLTKSSITVAIEVASIQTGIADRDKHLLSADFFDAESHPQITFSSDRITSVGDGYQATGTLRMHGVAREITLPFAVTKQDGNTIGFACETKVNRIEYGVGKDFVHSSIEQFLADEVDVQIYFWTRKKKAP